MSRSRPFWGAVVASSSGLCAAYAGMTVPLTTGWAITETGVQALVIACVLVGAIAGWLTAPRRAVPALVLVFGFLSFGVTRYAVMLMYPPALRG